MKKRILSLILALSMVLSVLPLGAFAADPNQELVMEGGYPVGSNNGTANCGGNGWSYDNNTQTLTLTSGEYDFSNTNPKTKTGSPTNQAVLCAIKIDSVVEITGGTFKGTVTNTWGVISGNGIFDGEVINDETIENGIFKGSVTNDELGTILGGTFAGRVDNSNGGQISGGVFNGNTGLNAVGNAHSIKWDDDYSSANNNAKIVAVNDVSLDGSAVWDPYVVVTASTEDQVVTITANTDIFSLNGYPIGTKYNSSYDGSDYKTVKFTMPGGPVALNQQITSDKGGELVMEGGYPKISIGGKYPCSGTGWTYREGNPSDPTDTGTLTLMSGSGPFDFNFADPTTKITRTDAAVACAIQSYATISGGIFEKKVTNNATGYITGGTFKGTVLNGSGVIKGGTFAAGLSEEQGIIFYGVFNGKTGLADDALYVTVTNGSVLKVNDEVPRKEDGTEDTAGAWNLYSYEGTTMTITADTEIFSLNGQPIDERNYPNKNDKTTVKFTMPGENVVLGTGELVMKDGWPEASKNGQISCSGTDWSYDHNTGTLTLTSGEYDFSSTHPQNTGAGTRPVPAVRCMIEIRSGVEITGGSFGNSVTNYGTISSGTFQTMGGGVINEGTIKNGTFTDSVTNNKTISGGTFQNGCRVTNYGTINGKGTFEGTVVNNATGDITGGTFQSTCSVTNTGIIKDGIFTIKVENGGIGEIFGGIFAAGLSRNDGNVAGGVFNGNATITGVRGLHSITWDTAYPNAKITKVNDVSADWKPYVVIDGDALPEVIITADTEIFSLNGKSIDDGNCKSSYDGNKNTVKFTMPDGPVVLNGAITCTDFVMEGGWPEDSNGGTIPCSGTGWSYDHNTKTLTLTSGEYDFSSTEPVQCAILLDSENAKITGGTFEEKVTNNGGTISDGTFNGTVENYGGKISSGTFKGTVQHWYGTISGGTFHEKVLNSHGEITGGTFAAGLSANNGAVTGGVFNGNTGLNGVTGLHSIKWDDAYPNAKIEKVNGVSANWAPYVVVTELTTATAKEVTITADTEIFSLNGQLLGADDRVNGDKKTVKFTMPDDMPDNENVVLNKAITSTDLVMKNGYPKDSNGGTIPCKGDGWQYIPNDPTYGNMLLLTGSNQTGGLFDFSTIGDGSAVECNVFVGKPTAITGGEFNGKVFNNSGILGGTFHGEVDNMGPGCIENGTFKNSVENNGMIENGTFEGTVENNTNGTISGGTFAGSVTNSGTVTGGVFNGNATLINVTGGHNITWDAAYPNAKIEKVNDVSANWAPYVVTSNATTKEVTITADTEIFSLNGQPIAESSYGVDKKTVTFTMPDDDVVLNGELITKPEPEPKPEPKPEPEPEPEPEPTTYTVTVIGGTIDGKTSVSAKENDTLTVVLDQNDIPDGMTFDLWSISSSKLSGDINVDYRAESMTFTMPAEDVTIRAQYRSAEIIEDAAPSPLATAATIAVGGAAAGIVVWQGVNLGVDLYLANALPQGVPVPTDRRALALLLWETAGKPEVALPTLYGDIPTEEIELQKATRWAVQNGLMDAADKKDASFFDPDHYVTKMDVFGAWLRLKKLLGTT